MTQPEWRDFRKVGVNNHPDRYVLFAVALVDSTGRLADPASLKLTHSLEIARRNADNLIYAHGGEAPYSYTAPAPDRGSSEPDYKPGRDYERGRWI